MITGQTLRDAILSGANNIANQRTRVDELNVFPVPDGDTGTNMSMTIATAAEALRKAAPASVGQASSVTASALLQGARGSKPCDLEALAEAACLISHMVDELRDIAEVDLNPVFAWEKGLAVADARIVLQAR